MENGDQINARAGHPRTGGGRTNYPKRVRFASQTRFGPGVLGMYPGNLAAAPRSTNVSRKRLSIQWTAAGPDLASAAESMCDPSCLLNSLSAFSKEMGLVQSRSFWDDTVPGERARMPGESAGEPVQEWH